METLRLNVFDVKKDKKAFGLSERFFDAKNAFNAYMGA